MKIARASQHLADLRARITLWATSAPYTVEPRISDDRTTVSFLVKVVVPPPTDEWSLYLGDALHALRSAGLLQSWVTGSVTRPGWPVWS